MWLKKKRIIIAAVGSIVFGYFSLADIQGCIVRRNIESVIEKSGPNASLVGLPTYAWEGTFWLGDIIYVYTFVCDGAVYRLPSERGLKSALGPTSVLWRSVEFETSHLPELEGAGKSNRICLCQITVTRPLSWYDWREFLR